MSAARSTDGVLLFSSSASSFNLPLTSSENALRRAAAFLKPPLNTQDWPYVKPAEKSFVLYGIKQLIICQNHTVIGGCFAFFIKRAQGFFLNGEAEHLRYSQR